jgi:uncharacterized membrane-anchored protein YitT (DUF2179 family)
VSTAGQGNGTVEFVTPRRHTLFEDGFAIVLGTALVGLGVMLYSEGQLAIGSTAGLALLLQYGTGIAFGILFFTINLPFYVLAVLRMGWPFAIKTFIAVGLVSAFSALMPQWIDVSSVHPLFASLMGGGLMGLGILSLFRHRASVGGINILSLYLQDNFGWRAGYVQMAIDGAILVAALFVLPLDRVIYSIAGAIVLNMIIATNHKPGRYVGFS